MNFLKKFRLSTIAIIIGALASITVDLSLKNWEKQDRVIEHDIHWYYAYLPSAFIYHDIKEEKSDYRFDDNYYLFWPTITADGKKVTKTTCGLAIMYAPFFFVAHAYASISDYPENGFSEPYKLFLLLSAVFYLVVGLGFLRKVLRHFDFKDAHIAITILLLGLGTNLLCYSSQSAPMSHVYNFCLFAIFIHYTIKWYQYNSMKNTIILGLLLGLISLIRPSNALIMVFFFLYGISSTGGFRERMRFFRRECFLLNVMVFVAVLVWIPQFLYWKEVTGNYLFYSYTDEGFFFKHPRIIDGLFSFRKGWLLYTPMMTLPLMGLFFKKIFRSPVMGKLRFAIIAFTVLNIYVIFSWWCWWYGGTFGQRSVIESYTLLSIPFAVVIQTVAKQKLWVKASFAMLCAFLIWLNVFQMYQYENLSLHWEGMTKELYIKQFGKMDKIPDYENYVSYPNFDEAKKGNDCNTPTAAAKAADQQNTADELSLKQNEKIITIKAPNGKFLCSDENKNQVIYADRDLAQGWETFRITYNENGTCFIMCHKNLYFSADLDSDARITATRVKASEWETFRIEKLEGNLVSFKAANEKYISLDPATLQIFANAGTVGEHEKFELITK